MYFAINDLLGSFVTCVSALSKGAGRSAAARSGWAAAADRRQLVGLIHHPSVVTPAERAGRRRRNSFVRMLDDSLEARVASVAVVDVPGAVAVAIADLEQRTEDLAHRRDRHPRHDDRSVHVVRKDRRDVRAVSY